MKKQAVVIFGPPGSGKGTQAELLTRGYQFINIDSGRCIESTLRDPDAKKNPELQKEKKLFDAGILTSPSWVLKFMHDIIGRVADSGHSIVLSGSLRTIYEAFGDKQKEGLATLLARKYGKKNVIVIRLNVADKSSLQRNTGRLICSVCGLQALEAAKAKQCSLCSGPLRKRTLDKPEVIKVRLKEYRERSYPVIKEMKKRGFKIYEINGEPLPYKVFESVKKNLRLS
ncbi:MAG: nucleoside monophosphate kinase [Patescibacteria group bacterium]